MEFRLMKPLDSCCPEIDQESVTRLKGRHEFSSDTEWALYQAKVLYEGFGDTGGAIGILEKQLALDPNDSRLRFCLAECYSRQSSTLEKALEHCKRGLSIDGESDYGHTIMARVHLALQRPIDAYQSAMAALLIPRQPMNRLW